MTILSEIGPIITQGLDVAFGEIAGVPLLGAIVYVAFLMIGIARGASLTTLVVIMNALSWVLWATGTMPGWVFALHLVASGLLIAIAGLFLYSSKYGG